MDLFSRVIFLTFHEEMFYQCFIYFKFFRDLFSARMLVTELLLKFFDISNSIIRI